ncbi:MAG: hypothetical protein AAFV07_14235, partial [Bacteroidota bacterium]
LQLKRTRRIVETSRMVGKVGQWEGAIATWLRDRAMRLTPARTQQKQLEFLYNVEFGQIPLVAG